MDEILQFTYCQYRSTVLLCIYGGLLVGSSETTATTRRYVAYWMVRTSNICPNTSFLRSIRYVAYPPDAWVMRLSISTRGSLAKYGAYRVALKPILDSFGGAPTPWGAPFGLQYSKVRRVSPNTGVHSSR